MDRITARRIAGVLNYDDARRAARRVLPRALFEYVDGGSEGELTKDANTAGFAALRLRPRVGTWMPEPELATTLFGERIAMPVLTAPCGALRLMHPEGDVGAARAASRAETIHVTSTASQFTMEEIAAQAPGRKWLQVFKIRGRAGMESLVDRAEAAGYGALVLTLDTQTRPMKYADRRNGFSYNMVASLRSAAGMAPQLAARPGWVWRYVRDGMPFDIANTARMKADGVPDPLSQMGATSLAPTWDDVAWCRERWEGPLVVKGLLTSDDARRALELGCDGIVVSNHGGRQLDSVPAAIDALPDIVAAVGGELEVLLDSGVRSGADVVKALSLGAKAVLVGRPYVYGLALGGAAGVERVLELFHDDLVRTLQLMGCPSVAALGERWIARMDGTRLLPA